MTAYHSSSVPLTRADTWPRPQPDVNADDDHDDDDAADVHVFNFQPSERVASPNEVTVKITSLQTGACLLG